MEKLAHSEKKMDLDLQETAWILSNHMVEQKMQIFKENKAMVYIKFKSTKQ